MDDLSSNYQHILKTAKRIKNCYCLYGGYYGRIRCWKNNPDWKIPTSHPIRNSRYPICVFWQEMIWANSQKCRLCPFRATVTKLPSEFCSLR